LNREYDLLKTHTIRSGETLGALAKKFGTSVEKLAQANNISNPNKITAGKKLVIPDGFDQPSSRPSQASSGGTPCGSGQHLCSGQQRARVGSGA